MLRLSVTFLCLVGLIYHTTHLIIQYSSGRTVVSIRVGRFRSENIPSLSICYPAFISWRKMAEVNDDSRKLLQTYQSIEEDQKNWNTSLSTQLYHQSIEKFPKHSRSIIELFDNLSIEFDSGKENKFTYAIDNKVGGVLKHHNDTLEYKTFEDRQPIESVSKEFGATFMRKCYTFFADLSPEWRDLKIEMDYMEFTINHDSEWFPIDYSENDDSHFNTFHISMHSSNTLPDFINGENHLKLRAGADSIWTYSQLNIELLQPPYDTKCKDYDLDDIHSNINMRTDCISFCVIDELKKLCQKDCIYQTAALLRRQLFVNSPNLTFCPEPGPSENVPCIENSIRQLNSFCLDKCQIECSIKFFAFEMKELRLKNHKKHSKMRTKITIKHNRLPDQLIKHYPEVNVITFISSFGGLLGMWLGMSVLASFELILKYF